MKKFSFKKFGILLAMMLVASAVLVGPVSAKWTYSTTSAYQIGANAQYSSYDYGFLYGGSAASYTGPQSISTTLTVLGTDAPNNPTYSASTVGTYLSTGMMGYYSDNEVNLRSYPYNPRTENWSLIGSQSVTVTGYP